MNKATVSIDGVGRIILAGWLTFATVNGVKQQLERIIQQSKLPNRVDLQQISHADSAGLALLIHCLRLAKCQQKLVCFENIPDNLISITTISGLNGLLFNEGRP